MNEKFHNITADNSSENAPDKDPKDQRALEIADRINDLKDKDELEDGEQKELLGLIDKLERMYSSETSEQLEAIPNLKEQYESQKALLEKAGVLTNLGKPRGSSESFMVDITDEMCTFPKYEEILEKMEAQKEMIEKKAEQGFTKLLIVPFGMKLENLIDKYKQALSKHAKDGKLLATKENPTDKDENLGFDAQNPLYVWDEYKGADISGKLVYYPQEFSKNHKGQTKEEVIKKDGAWSIRLIEGNPNIPREGKGKTQGGRKQLEANKTPNEYLKSLGKDQYSNETGLTPEDWLTQAITHLEETNEVIDDYQGKGSIPYLTGSYFPASGIVPSAYWDRDNRQADLNGSNPEYRGPRVGVRSSVRV